MGFVLQVSGILIIIPIIASLLLSETSQPTIALFITATVFFALGFVTNSLCEKKEMTYKQSCTLIVFVFIILSLIGAIPYLYINLPSEAFFQVLTDSLFESVSGFTTTGFSVIPDLSVLPQSIILYRGLTQFIGGIGVVLVLLAFFYPEAKLREFARSMGLSKDNHRIKKTFLFIIGLNCAFTAVMIAVGYALGYHDLINLASAVFSAVSTGGFSPVNDLSTLLTQTPLNVILPICMVFGASNILIFAGLYRKKFREFVNSETTVLLILIGIASAILAVFYGFTSYDAGFHVISAMSTTGFSYLPIAGWADSLKLFVVSLMFIGGASFSTAGGIKIYRLMLLFKSVPTTVNNAVTGKDIKVHLFEKDYGTGEIIQAAIMVFLTSALLIVSSLVVSYYGFNFVDALFDCTAAVATTGLSVGVVTPSLALELKWLFIILMIVGRVEIIVFLVMFSRVKETHAVNGSNKEMKHALPKTPEPELRELDDTPSSSINADDAPQKEEPRPDESAAAKYKEKTQTYETSEMP
jgi:trk system potassium uptake protein